MTHQNIEPVSFFQIDNRHDVDILKIEYESEKTLIITSDDINWNMEGSKNYKKLPASLIFHGVSDLIIDIFDYSGISIDDIEIKAVEKQYKICIYLNAGGGTNSLKDGNPSICFIFCNFTVSEL